LKLLEFFRSTHPVFKKMLFKAHQAKFQLNFFPINSNIDSPPILTPLGLNFVYHLRKKTALSK